MQASKAAMVRGLALSAACGVSYGLYSPAYNIATNDPWHMAGPGTSQPGPGTSQPGPCSTVQRRAQTITICY